MRLACTIALGLLASPATAQDLKVLLCTAVSQWNLNSDSLEPIPSDDSYTWELIYDGSELVALGAPFDCIEGSEEWEIGATVISLQCRQGIEDVRTVRLSAEINRYAQSFMISGISEGEEDGAASALWVQEGNCELARRKF